MSTAEPPVRKGDLLDHLTTDRTRGSEERETSIVWSAQDDAARVSTAERSLMRRFLNHPEFRLEWFAARVGDRGERAYQTAPQNGTEPDAGEWDGQPVLSVGGTIPVGCVTVKAAPREAAGHADVVTRGVID